MGGIFTIISPQAIVDASDTFVEWSQTGYKDDSPGTLRFYSASGLAGMTLTLTKRDGLYYTQTDVYTVDRDPLCRIAPTVHRVTTPTHPKHKVTHRQYTPVSKAAHTEAELWMLRLGSPGEDQLNMLPGNVTGIPSEFHYHPFRFLDFKEQACIWKHAAQCTAVRTGEAGKRFYMDFGFMRASSSDVVVVSKYATFHESMKKYDGGPTNHISSQSKLQQITARHVKT